MRFPPLLAALLVIGCSPTDDDETGPPPACDHVPRPAKRLRVFAVGHKLTISEGATYASYASAFRKTVETEVLPHLATDRPNVLVFPESVAFTAAFVGARGEVARSRESAFLAYVALQGAMPTAFDHYRSLSPDGSIGRWILLAATDPTWRAFEQTFSALARDHGVYVVASIDAGDARPLAADESHLAGVLGDPERTDASVAIVPDGKLYNQAVMFGPTGEQLGRMRKVYLTDPEHGELGISGHLPEAVTLSVDELANVAAMISRDAWMPDLQDRAIAGGADIFLQHEAFSTWTVADAGAPWPADNLKRSGWAATQKHPEVRMTAAPMLAGNFFDVGFDGQTFIATPGVPSMTRRALLAQPPDTGWAAIAPWVAPDPDGSIEARRTALRAIGETLLPGGTRANDHVEGTVFADLDIPADDGYPAIANASPDSLVFGTSAPVASSGVGRQRSASPIALPTGGIAVAWEDTRYCTGQILFARSDDGVTFQPPVRVAPWNRAQHAPSLASLPDGTLVVAWQEILEPGRAEIRVATSRDRGDTWTHRVRVDPDHTLDAWVPSLAADAVTGALYLAFVDTRPATDNLHDANRRIYLTRSDNAGVSWSAPLRLDPRERDRSNPDPTLTNEWSPRVVAHNDRVLVAYTHRERPDEAEQPSWDAHVIESLDGGARFSSPRRIDTGGFPERIAADPSLALSGDTWQLAYSTHRGAVAESQIALASSSDTALAFAPAPRDAWFPSIAALPDGGFVTAWQDFRDGGNDIYLSRAGSSSSSRVDDAGTSDAQAWRPRIAAAADGTIFVFWEDSRTGHAELRFVRGTLP